MQTDVKLLRKLPWPTPGNRKGVKGGGAMLGYLWAKGAFEKHYIERFRRDFRSISFLQEQMK